MANQRDSIKHKPYGDGLIRSYDIFGYKILQNETGEKYDEAIDIPNKYTYSETDEKISDVSEMKETEQEEK